MRMLGNQVLLRPAPYSDTTQSGVLFMPDGAVEDATGVAEVVAVGPGRYNGKGKLEPLDVKPGDNVTLLRFHMEEKKIRVGDEEFSIVAEPDLWGVIEK